MHQLIILVGNVGKDPDMRFVPSGQAVTSFSLATNRSYTNDAGEKIKETVWWRCTAWGKQAETINRYVHKGSKLYIEGRIKVDPKTGEPRIWTDKDGNPRASLEITISNFTFLSSKADDDNAVEKDTGDAANVKPEGAPVPTPTAPTDIPEEDDPFA